MKNNEIVMREVEKLKPQTPMSELALEVTSIDDKIDMLEVRIAIRRALAKIHKY